MNRMMKNRKFIAILLCIAMMFTIMPMGYAEDSTGDGGSNPASESSPASGEGSGGEAGGSDGSSENSGSEAGGTEGDGTEGDGTEGEGTEGDGTEGDGTEGEGTEGDGTEGDGTEGDGTEGDGTEGEGTEGEGTEGTEGEGAEGTEGEGAEGTEGEGTEGTEGTEGDEETFTHIDGCSDECTVEDCVCECHCTCGTTDGTHAEGCALYKEPEVESYVGETAEFKKGLVKVVFYDGVESGKYVTLPLPSFLLPKTVVITEQITAEDGTLWFRVESNKWPDKLDGYYYVKSDDVTIVEEEIEEAEIVELSGNVDGCDITVAGEIPETVTLSLAAVDTVEAVSTMEDVTEDTTIAAFDIKLLREDGTEWQPEDGSSITVTLDASALGMVDGLMYEVLHQHEGAVNNLGQYTVENGKVEFETDGFSVFVVTGLWGVADTAYGQTVTMYVGDTLYFKCNTAHSNGGNTQNHQWTVSSTVASIVKTYNYPDGSDNKRQNSYIQVTANQVGTVKLYCQDPANAVTINVVEKPENTSLTIEDQIRTNGCLIPEYTAEEGTVVTYKWYRNENLDGTGTYTEVTGDAITSDYAVTNGVNIAVDLGGKCWYKVEALDESGEVIATSEPYWVPYSNELENGSFETPNITGYNPFANWGAGNVQFNQEDSRYITTAENVRNGTALWWRTTGPGETNGAPGRDIEIVRPGNADLDGVYYVNPADENQYAELNCEAIGTLYQDVLTAPNTTLKWSFSHLGREGNDTMAVVVMPANTADEWADKLKGQTSADGINDVLKDIDELEGAVVWYNLEAGTEGNDTSPTWVSHSGEYETIDGQYLSRFFFVSVASASNSLTMGNLIDGVSFDDKLNYTIRYYIEGVEQSADRETGSVKPYTTVFASHTDKYSDYALEMVVKAANSVEDRTWGSTSMKVDTNDVYLDLHYVETGVSVNKKVVLTGTAGMTSEQITETQAALWNNYGTATFELKDGDKTVATATVTVNSETGEGVALFYNGTTKYVPDRNKTYTIVETSTHEKTGYLWTTSGNVTLNTGNSLTASAVYTNTYQPYIDLTITKTGCNETLDPNQSFVFTVSGKDADGNDMTLDVVIHGNGSTTIKNLRPGTSYTITEKSNWSWRYAPTQSSVTIDSLSNKNNAVTFDNERPNTLWLDGNAWCDNVFGKGVAKTDGAGVVQTTVFTMEAVLPESKESGDQTE